MEDVMLVLFGLFGLGIIHFVLLMIIIKKQKNISGDLYGYGLMIRSIEKSREKEDKEEDIKSNSVSSEKRKKQKELDEIQVSLRAKMDRVEKLKEELMEE